MQKTIFELVLLLFFCSNQAMNKKKPLWVKTTDDNPLLVKPRAIASSNLLLILSEKYRGSDTHPLIIPQALSINNETLQFYCCYSKIPAKNLWNDLKSDSYFKLVDAAAKLKALKIYIDLVTEILPPENQYAGLQGNITKTWIRHLLVRDMIRKENASYIFPAKKALTKLTQATTLITDDGTYLVHNFCNPIEGPQIKLYNTITKENESLHESKENQRIYCSPNNNYIIIVDLFRGIYVYHIPKKKMHYLYQPHNQESDIIISDNSTYILSQQMLPFNDYKIIYKLWSIDDDRAQEINLGNNLSESKSAIFHPDSENIFHLNEGKLYVYNIATGINKSLDRMDSAGPKRLPKQFTLYDTLVMSTDKKHIICKMKNYRNTSLSDHFNYVILNIENSKEITFTILPSVLKTHVPPLCIPHKDLIAYCADNMQLLQLFNKKGILMASHTKEKHRISALASDKSGNYLACGYSNGSILLVNTSDIGKKIFGTQLGGLNLPIKNLTFTDNNLLFAHAKPELFVPNKHSGYASLWDTQGNYIINFGSSVFDANVSKSGKSIAIIESDIQSRNTSKKLELTCYLLNKPLPAPTLKQAYNLLQGSKK